MAGDIFRKVQSGSPVVPSAIVHNEQLAAIRANRDRAAAIGRQMIPGSRRPEIIWVKNTTEEPWGIWSPILVGYQSAELAEEKAIAFASNPYWLGYLPNASTSVTAYPVLGITQEPIGPGKVGPVCIDGPTFALMQKPPTGWSNYAGWDRVHVWYYPAAGDDPERFTLRNGAGGDATLLQIIDPSNVYLDGTYDDQYLVWIDLEPFPEKGWFLNTTGAELPPHSIIKRSVLGGGVKIPSTASSINFYVEDVWASPGFPVAAGAYAWGYRVNPTTPVKVRFALDYNPNLGGMIGPAGQQLAAWPDLPLFLVHSLDWYKSGEDRFAWVYRREPRNFYCKRSGSTSYYLCTPGGAAVYDGTSYGGITYPIMKASLADLDLYTGSSFTQPRELNIQPGQVFIAQSVKGGGSIVPANAYYDDPIGTVKIWISSADPPPGWRVYSQLEGRFPVGYSSGDADFGSYGAGGAKTHSHGSVYKTGGGDAAAADVAVKHLPPYRVVRFIERYQ